MIRILDLFFVVLGLICLSWVLITAAIILPFTGEHKVLYRQKRVGKGGKEFVLYKFATMLEDSANLPGGIVTRENDPRILPFGNYLRRTKVNELPQLFNILKGDMSFVGPRPQLKAHYDKYTSAQKVLIDQMTPGITGIGSLFFRNEDLILKNSGADYEYFHDEVITPYKGELECWYAQNKSVGLYLKIIYLTAASIVNRHYRTLERFTNLPTPPKELLEALPPESRQAFMTS